MHRARFAEGRIFSDRARALLGMLADPQPLMVLKTMANASAVSVKTGNPTETDSLFQSVIAFCQNNFGPNHYLLGHIMRNYAEFLRTVHRSADARAAKRRSKAILESFSKDNLLGHTVDATAFR